jgi:hypothetical protein
MGNFRTGSRIKLLFYDPLCQGKKGTTGNTKGFEVTGNVDGGLYYSEWIASPRNDIL